MYRITLECHDVPTAAGDEAGAPSSRSTDRCDRTAEVLVRCGAVALLQHLNANQ